jgi:hypothetical protein
MQPVPCCPAASYRLSSMRHSVAVYPHLNVCGWWLAAGVIPIDRLTDVRAPVEAIAARVGRRQLEGVYGLRLPQPARQEDPNRCGQAQLATHNGCFLCTCMCCHLLPNPRA